MLCIAAGVVAWDWHCRAGVAARAEVVARDWHCQADVAARADVAAQADVAG